MASITNSTKASRNSAVMNRLVRTTECPMIGSTISRPAIGTRTVITASAVELARST